METASKIRTARRIPRQGTGQRSHQETTAQNSTRHFNGYGFLKHRFTPLVADSRHTLDDWRNVERDFFQSLGYLSDLYGFKTADVTGRVFPDNIRIAYHDAAAQVTAARPDLRLLIVQQHKGRQATLVTAKPFDTGMTLYYVPVRPLWECLQDKKRQPLAHLLLSVYACLYQLARMPYFTEDDSYLGSTYDMMEEWLREDPDTEDYAAQVSCFNELKWFGKRILRSIRHPYHLRQFGSRLQAFQPATEHDSKLHQVCMQINELFIQYPDRSVFANIRQGWIDPKEEQRISPEDYISFYWDDSGDMCQQLMETINYDLQERPISDEPLGMQLFDMPQHAILSHELEFEKRFFDLLNDLTALL